MFLQVSVCPQGGCLPQCMLGCHTPPGPGRHPPRTRQTPPGPGRPSQTRQTPQADTPPGPGRPPQTRQTPPGRHTPPDQADPLGLGRPPGPGRPPSPPGKQSPAYGLRAAGTHPTGMHSCWPLLTHYLDSAAVLFTRLFYNNKSDSIQNLYITPATA